MVGHFLPIVRGSGFSPAPRMAHTPSCNCCYPTGSWPVRWQQRCVCVASKPDPGTNRCLMATRLSPVALLIEISRWHAHLRRACLECHFTLNWTMARSRTSALLCPRRCTPADRRGGAIPCPGRGCPLLSGRPAGNGRSVSPDDRPGLPDDRRPECPGRSTRRRAGLHQRPCG